VIWTLALYLLAGFALDCIITYHFRCVAHGRQYLAAITTFVYIVLSFMVLGQILTHAGTIFNTMAYAAGSAVGSLIVTARQRSEAE
jgi:uncharacterized protein YebE (UPF0316 family)